MTATSMVKEHPLPPRSGSGGADECGDAMIAMLEDQLAAERQSRHETEAALRETRAAMIKHQQIGRMGDFRYNTRTQRVRGSLEFYKLFGFDPALGEIDLVTWTEKIHPDEHVRVVKTLFDTIAALEPIQFECRIRLGDETRCIRCEAELNHDHVGDPVYYGVLTDVTECRTGEEALRRAEAELATSLRLASMGELAGSIIHEIGQPLASIASSADACRRWIAGGLDHQDRVLASLGRVIDESRRAAAVVAGLKSLIRDANPAIAPLDVEERCAKSPRSQPPRWRASTCCSRPSFRRTCRVRSATACRSNR